MYYFTIPSQYINSKETKLTNISSDNLYTLYRHYNEMDRFLTEDYAAYVLDTGDDEYLLQRFPEVSVDFVRDYINNNISYKSEDVEYPKFPIETLYEGEGDCEDRAIFGASLLALHGYNVSLVKSSTHMVIKVDNSVFIPESVRVLKEYPITNRPVVFHYWGDVIKKKTTFSTSFEGNLFVENRGSKYGDITISISGENKTTRIEPFSKIEFSFTIQNKEAIDTKLYLDGVFIDEVEESE